MAYEGYQILSVVWFLWGVVYIAKGAANLRGKALDKKATARVCAQDMLAWRRIQAIISFVLAAIPLIVSVNTFFFGGGQSAQSAVSGRIFACVIGLCALDLGLLAYSYWRYAPKDKP